MALGLTFAVTIGLIAGCSNKQDNSKRTQRLRMLLRLSMKIRRNITMILAI